MGGIVRDEGPSHAVGADGEDRVRLIPGEGARDRRHAVRIQQRAGQGDGAEGLAVDEGGTAEGGRAGGDALVGRADPDGDQEVIVVVRDHPDSDRADLALSIGIHRADGQGEDAVGIHRRAAGVVPAVQTDSRAVELEGIAQASVLAGVGEGGHQGGDIKGVGPRVVVHYGEGALLRGGGWSIVDHAAAVRGELAAPDTGAVFKGVVGVEQAHRGGHAAVLPHAGGGIVVRDVLQHVVHALDEPVEGLPEVIAAGGIVTEIGYSGGGLVHGRGAVVGLDQLHLGRREQEGDDLPGLILAAGVAGGVCRRRDGEGVPLGVRAGVAGDNVIRALGEGPAVQGDDDALGQGLAVDAVQALRREHKLAVDAVARGRVQGEDRVGQVGPGDGEGVPGEGSCAHRGAVRVLHGDYGEHGVALPGGHAVKSGGAGGGKGRAVIDEHAVFRREGVRAAQGLGAAGYPAVPVQLHRAALGQGIPGEGQGKGHVVFAEGHLAGLLRDGAAQAASHHPEGLGLVDAARAGPRQVHRSAGGDVHQGVAVRQQVGHGEGIAGVAAGGQVVQCAALQRDAAVGAHLQVDDGAALQGECAAAGVAVGDLDVVHRAVPKVAAVPDGEVGALDDLNELGAVVVSAGEGVAVQVDGQVGVVQVVGVQLGGRVPEVLIQCQHAAAPGLHGGKGLGHRGEVVAVHAGRVGPGIAPGAVAVIADGVLRAEDDLHVLDGAGRKVAAVQVEAAVQEGFLPLGGAEGIVAESRQQVAQGEACVGDRICAVVAGKADLAVGAAVQIRPQCGIAEEAQHTDGAGEVVGPHLAAPEHADALAAGARYGLDASRAGEAQEAVDVDAVAAVQPEAVEVQRHAAVHRTEGLEAVAQQLDDVAVRHVGHSLPQVPGVRRVVQHVAEGIADRHRHGHAADGAVEVGVHRSVGADIAARLARTVLIAAVVAADIAAVGARVGGVPQVVHVRHHRHLHRQHITTCVPEVLHQFAVRVGKGVAIGQHRAEAVGISVDVDLAKAAAGELHLTAVFRVQSGRGTHGTAADVRRAAALCTDDHTAKGAAGEVQNAGALRGKVPTPVKGAVGEVQRAALPGLDADGTVLEGVLEAAAADVHRTVGDRDAVGRQDKAAAGDVRRAAGEAQRARVVAVGEGHLAAAVGRQVFHRGHVYDWIA